MAVDNAPHLPRVWRFLTAERDAIEAAKRGACREVIEPMGWDSERRYYYRSVKVDGRVVTRYVGSGLVAALAAAADAAERERRRLQREDMAARMAEAKQVDEIVGRLDGVAELLADAAMLAAGLREHRGCWRRRRG